MATVARRCEGVGAGARRSQVIFLPASGILPPDSSGFVISPFLQNTVIFKSLSWDYKTNNPCMFGKRIIIAPLLDVWRSGWVRFSSDGHTKIDDLARPFYVLDGRNVPDYRVSDGAKLDAFFSENQFNGKVFECDYFSVRYYKKGSAHITFKRPDLVEKINNLVASHYPGMLPPRV